MGPLDLRALEIRRRAFEADRHPLLEERVTGHQRGHNGQIEDEPPAGELPADEEERASHGSRRLTARGISVSRFDHTFTLSWTCRARKRFPAGPGGLL